MARLTMENHQLSILVGMMFLCAASSNPTRTALGLLWVAIALLQAWF